MELGFGLTFIKLYRFQTLGFSYSHPGDLQIKYRVSVLRKVFRNIFFKIQFWETVKVPGLMKQWNKSEDVL